jgi:pimeloyl-ACP methyl ester carboxylesterase
VTHDWLLLRGLVREARHWGGFPDALARATSARVLCLDLPGTGREHARPSPDSIDGIVDDLRGRFAAERGDARWGLLAVSLGGMVALRWSSRFPEDFVRVAVCNTSSSDLSSPLERFKPGRWPTIAAAAISRDLVARERRILAMTTNSPDLDREALARQWATYARECPISRVTLVRQLMAGSRSRAPERAEVPTLVLCADGDRLVDSACSKRIAAKLGAELKVHPWAGHDLASDDPEWMLNSLANGSR